MFANGLPSLNREITLSMRREVRENSRKKILSGAISRTDKTDGWDGSEASGRMASALRGPSPGSLAKKRLAG
jgi:hypothetical protein